MVNTIGFTSLWIVIYPVNSTIQRLNNRDLALAYILSNGSIDHQGKGRGEREELSLPCSHFLNVTQPSPVLRDIQKTAARETKENWA